MEKNIRRMCGIEESSRRRGFVDFAVEVSTSHAVSLPRIKIPKPASQEISRNEEAEMRAWAKMHGKSVRQRNVRRDNTMDRVGTVLKPVNLNSLKAVERVPSESDEPPNSNEDVSLPPKSPNNEQVDSFSARDSDSDSEEEVDSALETTLRMIQPTRFRRIRTVTSRMTDLCRQE